MPLDGKNYTDTLTDTEKAARDDLFLWLDRFPARVPALREAVREGWLFGTDFAGPCRCVIGTLRFCDDKGSWNEFYAVYPNGRPEGGTPVEHFVVNVEPGDTPATSDTMAHLEEWIMQWQAA